MLPHSVLATSTWVICLAGEGPVAFPGVCALCDHLAYDFCAGGCSGYPWDRLEHALLSCASPRVVCPPGSVASTTAVSKLGAGPAWLGEGGGKGGYVDLPIAPCGDFVLLVVSLVCDV